jgi:hypothetical protein
MDEKQKRILTIVFILANLIIWSIFIIPRIGSFSAILFTNLSPPEDMASHYSRDVAATRDMLERIDFHTLRDPFLLPERLREPQPRPRPQTQPTREQPSSQRPREEEIDTRFVSRFQLKSIVQIEDSFIATLEESERYGSGAPSGPPAPYSYRFGYEEQQTPQRAAQTHMVIKGDTVMDETVVKITADSLIMSKNNQYYKLTFSGGYPVSKP